MRTLQITRFSLLLLNNAGFETLKLSWWQFIRSEFYSLKLILKRSRRVLKTTVPIFLLSNLSPQRLHAVGDSKLIAGHVAREHFIYPLQSIFITPSDSIVLPASILILFVKEVVIQVTMPCVFLWDLALYRSLANVALGFGEWLEGQQQQNPGIPWRWYCCWLIIFGTAYVW